DLDFFFFQAEDGIRGKLVTGVQTCALPILIANPTSGTQQATVTLAPQLNQTSTGQCVAPQGNTALYWDIGLRGDTGPNNHSSGEIGRASCRERREEHAFDGEREDRQDEHEG